MPKRIHVVSVLIVAWAAVLIYAGHLVTSSPIFWGGAVCEQTQGIRACYGYPPLGLAFLLGVAVVLGDGSYKFVELCLSRNGGNRRARD